MRTRMIRTTVAFLGLLCCVVVEAQAPKLVTSQASWDVGTLWHGESRTLKVELRNEGDADLELIDLLSSCGCTAANRPEPLIRPGDSVDLEIKFDSTGRFGKVTSTITLVTNDPVRPQVVFHIQAEVKKSVTVEPPGGVMLRATELKTDQVGVARLQNRESRPMKAELESLSAPEVFAVELKEIEAGEIYDLVVKLRSPLTQSTRGQVVVRTGHEREPLLTIPIVATLVRRIELQPPALFVAKSLGRPSQRRVQVHSFGDKPVAIKRVECPAGLVTARDITNPGPPSGSMAKVNPAPISEVTVTLGLPPGHEIPAEGLNVRLVTDDPDVPYLELYVTNDSAVHREKMNMAGRRG